MLRLSLRSLDLKHIHSLLVWLVLDANGKHIVRLVGIGKVSVNYMGAL